MSESDRQSIAVKLEEEDVEREEREEVGEMKGKKGQKNFVERHTRREDCSHNHTTVAVGDNMSGSVGWVTCVYHGWVRISDTV